MPMPDIDSALAEVANSRRADPLAPVTVIAPSHAAGLQMRRRLAEKRAFAAVRFETLPRVAELLAAGHLAALGRSPLARPIGDFVAAQVALESRGALVKISGLPGYARALRKIFRRLRRGGIRSSADVQGDYGARLAEILRLYDRYREETARFYDDEDLLDAAAEALRSGRAGVVGDLGVVYVVPPGALTAGSDRLLAALRDAVPAYTLLDETEGAPDTRFVLAPDPASEAREAVREVVTALESGASVHEIAVFHGADASYGRLLREAFEAADMTAAPLPGIPLIEKPAGCAVLALARLPGSGFSRLVTMDLLSAAAVRPLLPGRDGEVQAMTTVWDRLSREAGITRGADGWERALTAFVADKAELARGFDERGEEDRAQRARRDAERAEVLLGVVRALVERLEPLGQPQGAEAFIRAFTKVVDEYVDRKAEAWEDVLYEIEQLGTVDALTDSSFKLADFAETLAANLEAAYVRPRSLGDGVVIADYRIAAGLRFRHVVLCGAYEGALPAGPGPDALVEDRVWEGLRERHPFVEDASLRVQRARESAERAVASAAGGTLVWSAPRYQPGGTREYYPSPLMAEAAGKRDPGIATASTLRQRTGNGGWLRREASPLAVMLHGCVVDVAELGLRQAILRRKDGRVPEGERMQRALAMLRARGGRDFTEWDGNVSALSDDAWLTLQSAVSPTSLENYGACGFRYLCRSLLRLNVMEEPEEREMMEPAVRGTLIHKVLERFFRAQQQRGRPPPQEAWTEADRAFLVSILDEELKNAATRGLTGLDVYAQHEARTIRADLAWFLDADTVFRQETGAAPSEFEVRIPEVEVAGVRLRGVADRIDRTPDGRRAWVIDYKTGGLSNFKGISDDDPLAGGTKLQLPVYLGAARDADEAQSLYWFNTLKGEFKRIPYEPTARNQELFKRTLEAIVAGIRAGAFPASPGEEDEYYGGFENCKYCDFTRICSRRRDDEFEAKQGDRGFAPWLAVGRAARGEDGA